MGEEEDHTTTLELVEGVREGVQEEVYEQEVGEAAFYRPVLNASVAAGAEEDHLSCGPPSAELSDQEGEAGDASCTDALNRRQVGRPAPPVALRGGQEAGRAGGGRA